MVLKLGTATKQSTVKLGTLAPKAKIAPKTPALKPTVAPKPSNPLSLSPGLVAAANKMATTKKMTSIPTRVISFKVNGQKAPEQKLKIKSVNLNNPVIITPGTTDWIRKNDDYKLLASVKSKDRSEDLYAWANSGKNPVRNRDYVNGKYMCLQFASDFVTASRKDGFDTYVLSLQDMDAMSGHAVVGLRVGDHVYQYDPRSNTDISNPMSWNVVIKNAMAIKQPLGESDYLRSVKPEIDALIKSGKYTTIPYKYNIPMLSIFEPGIPTQRPVSLENIDKINPNKNYDFDVIGVVEPGSGINLGTPKSVPANAWVSDEFKPQI